MSGLSCRFSLTGMSRGVPFHTLHLLQRSDHPHQQLLCSDQDRHCLSSSLLHSQCSEEGLAYHRAGINIWEGVNTEGISSQFAEETVLFSLPKEGKRQALGKTAQQGNHWDRYPSWFPFQYRAPLYLK